MNMTRAEILTLQPALKCFCKMQLYMNNEVVKDKVYGILDSPETLRLRFDTGSCSDIFFVR